MPEQFDPEWEYFVPDAEVQEAIDNDRSYIHYTHIPFDEESAGGGNVSSGFSINSSPNAFTFQAPERIGASFQREVKYYPPKDCLKCGYTFNPRNERNVYCSRGCFEERVRPVKVYDVICANSHCQTQFKTLDQKRRYCCRDCFSIDRFNKELDVRSCDGKLKGSLFTHRTFICKNQNCRREFNAKRSNQVYCSRECYPGGNLRKLKVRPCAYSQCQVIFQPKRNSSTYCSKACSRRAVVERLGIALQDRTIICFNLECRKKFQTVRKTVRFCSPACGSKYYQRLKEDESKQQAENAVNQSSVKLEIIGTCVRCDGPISVSEESKKGNWKKKVYCSQRCRHLVRQQRYEQKRREKNKQMVKG